MLNTLDLFSGIGGFTLGLEATGGFRTAAFCEALPSCRHLLGHHWPDVPCHPDVRELDGRWLADRGLGVDVIVGGFPCQDLSVAGKGAGLDGARSGLWREIVRLVDELGPRFVLVENVSALRGRGLDVVIGDLAALGFDAEWDCIPASAVGAPHQRDRIWILGHREPDGFGDTFKRALAGELASVRARLLSDPSGGRHGRDGPRPFEVTRNGRSIDAGVRPRPDAQADALGPDADGFGPYRAPLHDGRSELRDEQGRVAGPLGSTLADADGQPQSQEREGHGGRADRPEQPARAGAGRRIEPGRRSGRDGGDTAATFVEGAPARPVAHAEGFGERTGLCAGEPAGERRRRSGDGRGARQLADASGSRLEGLAGHGPHGPGRTRPDRYLAAGGVRALDDTLLGRHGPSGPEVRPGRNSALDAGWWSAEPNVGRVAHGVPARVDRLHGLGNALVPAIPYALGRAVLTALAS